MTAGAARGGGPLSRRHTLQLGLYPFELGDLAERLEDPQRFFEVSAGLLHGAEAAAEQPVLVVHVGLCGGGGGVDPAQLDRLLEEDEPRILALPSPERAHQRVDLDQPAAAVPRDRYLLRAAQLLFGVEVALRVDHQLGDVEADRDRSEEHTSELQSLAYLVCRLLLEKKKNTPEPSY